MHQDPFFYLAMVVIVCFAYDVIYNLWNK